MKANGTRWTWSWLPVCILLGGFALALTSCQAPLETKRGDIGDFCNGEDMDCREGLLCQEGVCDTINNSPDACTKVCDIFGACGARLSGCREGCIDALKFWKTSVIDQYKRCYVEQISCQQIQAAENPQQICYDRLPAAPQERLDRCNSLRSTGQQCLGGASGQYEESFNSFDSNCQLQARTRADQIWARSDDCVEAGDAGNCGQLFRCVNRVFNVDPKFPTSDPSAN